MFRNYKLTTFALSLVLLLNFSVTDGFSEEIIITSEKPGEVDIPEEYELQELELKSERTESSDDATIDTETTLHRSSPVTEHSKTLNDDVDVVSESGTVIYWYEGSGSVNNELDNSVKLDTDAKIEEGIINSKETKAKTSSPKFLNNISVSVSTKEEQYLPAAVETLVMPVDSDGMKSVYIPEEERAKSVKSTLKTAKSDGLSDLKEKRTKRKTYFRKALEEKRVEMGKKEKEIN